MGPTRFLKFTIQAGSHLQESNPRGWETKGEVLLLLIFFLGSFAMVTAIYQKKLLLYNEEIEQRRQTYLCFKETIDQYENLLNFMGKTNTAITGINAALLLKPTPELVQLKKVIQKSQQVKGNIIHLRAVKGFGCFGIQKLSLLNLFPLERKGTDFKRDLQGKILFKTKTQNFTLPSNSKFPFLFSLKGKVQFLPKLQVSQLKEVSHLKPENI